MTHDEQVAALQARLDDVNSSIAHLETALNASQDPDERAGLLAQVAQLQQTAITLRTMLNNLSTSSAPMAMAVAPAVARNTVQGHTAAVVASAKASASQSNDRAQQTLNLMTP